MSFIFNTIGSLMAKVGEASTSYSIWWICDEPTCPKELQK